MGEGSGPEGEDATASGADAPASADGPASSPIGEVLAGRYRIEAVIAKGGVGAVYVGTHVHMRNRVAIKLLHPEMADLPELVQRFERESIVGAHANHTNVASATDFGQLDDGSYYLVCEYVDGITLHELLKRGPIDVQRAVSIARQIACGLEAIHKQDIVHRDLKPRNVMVAEGDPDVVKLIDFGFAKLPVERFVVDKKKAAALTSKGVVFGTPGFMAPEVTFGMHAVQAPSDLYALGVILYEMLVGKHPFDKRAPKELMVCHQLDAPPPFRKRAPERDIPAALERITLRLLEKAPDDRPESATAVIAALDDAMAALQRQAELDDASPLPAADAAPLSLPTRRFESGDNELPEPDLAEAEVQAQVPSVEEPADRAASASTSRPARKSKASWPWLLLGALVLFAVALKMVPDLRQRLSALVSGEPLADASATAPAPQPTMVASVAPSALASARPAGSAALATSTAPPSAPSASATPAAPRPTIVDGHDAAGWRVQLKTAVKWSDSRTAATAILALGSIDPEQLVDRAVVKDAAQALVLIALGDEQVADEVFALLAAEESGAAGPDLFYQLLVAQAATKAAKRASALLKQPDVLARGTPAMRVALALFQAPCADKAQHFERVSADGDQRALMQLLDMRPPRCNEQGGCCLGHDPRYRDAFRALGARRNAP